MIIKTKNGKKTQTFYFDQKTRTIKTRNTENKGIKFKSRNNDNKGFTIYNNGNRPDMHIDPIMIKMGN